MENIQQYPQSDCTSYPVAVQNAERLLVERYGVLLTLAEAADLFDRSIDGLRVSLNRNTEFSDSLCGARVRIGRRIYFQASELAKLIVERTQ